uniref:Uncharacterized protein n=1 Tax=Anser brachyrhynchus TaxID=132585 RepID=A0A8B9BEQ0_9AVES
PGSGARREQKTPIPSHPIPSHPIPSHPIPSRIKEHTMQRLYYTAMQPHFLAFMFSIIKEIKPFRAFITFL